MWKDPIVEETRNRRERVYSTLQFRYQGHQEGAEAAADGERTKAEHSLTEAVFELLWHNPALQVTRRG